ncbi:uncharacterized protein LOC9655091 isoform X2 [Selaginella moellendorffii]|uniref:uncharacterized protein LOC9655091 isoform X2 n=1 Tax=Selaginella moellendorffii TaxID=88036 RepID=UPI000D1C6B7B|nr:uncharacterized protein LOC9655091 isoform X2 [Selaginella moellendorffii]|eukprot:XP_024544450.1 uncharacterized protein LOC9655091 isoform X2 [Selaginella moellendorffii]
MLGAFVSCPKGHRFKICASCGQQNKAGLVSHELTLLVHGACCAGATMGDHQARKETALFSEDGIDAAILVNASSLLPLFFLKERPGCMDAEGLADPANLRPDSTKFKRDLDARAKEEEELFYVRWNSGVLIPARFPISTLPRLLQAASTALHTTASPSTGELTTKRTISSNFPARPRRSTMHT